MKGFEFLAIQSWEKYIDFKKTKGKNALACLKEKKQETHEPPSSEIGEVEGVLHEEVEIHSQMNLKNMRKHHMRRKKSTLKLLNIMLKQILLWIWTEGHLLMDV